MRSSKVHPTLVKPPERAASVVSGLADEAHGLGLEASLVGEEEVAGDRVGVVGVMQPGLVRRDRRRLPVDLSQGVVEGRGVGSGSGLG